MKALTVRQPWAWAIAAGVKTVENRTRGTLHRGPLAIHAGQGWSERGLISPLIRADWRTAADPRLLEDEWADSFTRGAVVAVAQLVDSHSAESPAVVRQADGSWVSEDGCCTNPYAEFVVYVDDQRDTTRDVVHLVLADVVALDEPVRCRGALGFWNLPADVDEMVTAQLLASVGHPQ